MATPATTRPEYSMPTPIKTEGATATSATSGTPASDDAELGTPERSLGQLVTAAPKDLSAVTHHLMDLAKAEMAPQGAIAGKGAGMLAVAGVLALFALSMLLFAASYGLMAAGIWPWLSFLIVGVVLLIVVGILALLGRSALKKIQVKPERTIKQAKATIEALKSKS